MSPGRGPIRLVVTSRRVPVAVTEFELPYMTPYGIASKTKKRSIVYDYVLDEGERRIVEEVRWSAGKSGVSLEVVDLGKAGPLRRVFRSLLDRLTSRTRLLQPRNRFVRLRNAESMSSAVSLNGQATIPNRVTDPVCGSEKIQILSEI